MRTFLSIILGLFPVVVFSADTGYFVHMEKELFFYDGRKIEGQRLFIGEDLKIKDLTVRLSFKDTLFNENKNPDRVLYANVLTGYQAVRFGDEIIGISGEISNSYEPTSDVSKISSITYNEKDILIDYKINEKNRIDLGLLRRNDKNYIDLQLEKTQDFKLIVFFNNNEAQLRMQVTYDF